MSWRSRRAGDGRLAAARRSTALGPGGPDGPGVDYYDTNDTVCFKWRDWRTPPARVVPRAFTVVFFSLSHLVIRVARPAGGTGRAAAAGYETLDAGQAPARASLAGLPIST